MLIISILFAILIRHYLKINQIKAFLKLNCIAQILKRYTKALDKK